MFPHFLIQLVCVLLIVGLVLYLIGLTPINATIKLAIQAVVIVLVIVWLILQVSGMAGL